MVFGPRVVVTVPDASASAAKATKSKAKHRAKALAAAASDCPSGWFCLFDGSSFSGAMGKWSSTSYWQNLADYGWQGRGSSMVNRRNGYTLLERGDNARYCAVPNSQDGDLSNNGFNNNTTRVYLSTATDYHSAWGCIN